MLEIQRIEEITDEDWLSVNPENRRIVDEFIKQSKQLSPQTLKQYVSALRIYFYYIKCNARDKPFYELKSRDYLFYQNWLTEKGLSSSAIKLKRSAVSSINNYISLYYADEYKMFRNYVTKAISTPPPAFVHEKEPLTMQEYADLCAELEKRELWQQVAYLRFSFASGARRAEVRQLLKEVVDYEPKIFQTDNGEVRLYTTNPVRCKGRGVTGKVKKLNFDQEAMDAIKKWLSIRGDDDCPHVFAVRKDGKYQQVKESTFNSWTEIYFSKIIGRRFHPHAIRESRATTLVVEQKKDIKAAQKLLNHQSSTTTEIYVIRKDEDNADDAFI
jgi:integrase